MIEPYCNHGGITIYHGDCLSVMVELEPESISAVVTDPPYGLSFMGREWDHGVPGVPFWEAALRVTKPGGMLLAFGGTRTYHRLACAIEDAGWEIRDCLSWLYGSGFPKSLDISKAIDRKRDDGEARERVALWLRPFVERFGFEQLTEAFGFKDQTMARARWTSASQPQTPTLEQWARLKALLGLPDDMDAEVWRLNGRKGQPGENWEKREKIGEKMAGIATPGDVGRHTVGGSRAVPVDITAPATDLARLWSGYGTALKPAWEPIVLAMKPLDGTFAANAEKHGVAGVNVDGCRVGTEGGTRRDGKATEPNAAGWANMKGHGIADLNAGRFPANLALDEEAARMLDEQSGESTSPGVVTRGGGRSMAFGMKRQKAVPCPSDSGGASRFFYTAKASKADRGTHNDHPTVKPVSLMRWLVRMVTMPEGTVILDPFAGSGTTPYACREEHVRCIAIEQDEHNCEIAAKRLAQEVFEFSG